MITVFILSSDGTSNIMSDIASSIIERSPLAPVFLSIALSAIASIASSSNSSFTPSNANKALYCFISAFFGSVRIVISVFLSSLSSLAKTGSLPINSGINPNLSKSCGISLPSNSLMLDSFLLEICAPNPKPCLPVLEPIIFSIPSKAPPHINKIFVVSI